MSAVRWRINIRIGSAGLLQPQISTHAIGLRNIFPARPRILLICLLSMGSSPLFCRSHPTVHWGPKRDDLQLGINISSQNRDPQLNVFFANRGKHPFTIDLGQAGDLAGFPFRVWAVNPKTREETYLFIFIGSGGPAALVKVGLPLPTVKRQVPGGTALKVWIPMAVLGRDLGREQSASTLLHQGYKLIVRYEYSRPANKFQALQMELADHPDLWFGKAVSGEVGLTLPKEIEPH